MEKYNYIILLGKFKLFFSFNLIVFEKRLSEFRKVRKIGEGTYDEVHEALDIANNNLRVAMKKLLIENKDGGIPITALREICILKHLHHENVVDLYEIIQDVDKSC